MLNDLMTLYPKVRVCYGTAKARWLYPCKWQCVYLLFRLIVFNNQVIPIWNSLPNHAVSADTINTFKNRLDKFWSDQEVLYDYNTDLHGIGNRSLL